MACTFLLSLQSEIVCAHLASNDCSEVMDAHDMMRCIHERTVLSCEATKRFMPSHTSLEMQHQNFRCYACASVGSESCYQTGETGSRAHLALEVLEVSFLFHSCSSDWLLGGGGVLGIEGGSRIHSNRGGLLWQARLHRLNHGVLLPCGVCHHSLLVTLPPCVCSIVMCL